MFSTPGSLVEGYESQRKRRKPSLKLKFTPNVATFNCGMS